MPQVGQDIKTAVIVEWFKKENDPVQKGDIIATVESDKAAFDVEAYESGVLLKILYPRGQEIEVLTPIAYIGRPGESIEQPQSATQSTTQSAKDDSPSPPAPTQQTQRETELAASPSARRLARERGIDLEAITGTGPGGRITKKDVLEAISSQDTRRQVQSASEEDEVVPFSPMRTRIAERLTRSTQTIPHFHLFTDVDMTETSVWRRRFSDRSGIKITVTDMVVKAAALALAEYPKMNAHVQASKIILKKQVNVGVAVPLKDGLAVPVIAGADKKDIAEISHESRQNAEAIRAGKLLSNATSSFTVSNLGMYAVDMFLPIINPPECAILAVGRAVERPAVVGGQLGVRRIMTMTLACDHRAVDGTYAAQFLERIKQYLENPNSFEE
jgi:pyruvate dehydrogenase E2 component (dihydrolipoamide acetyltransferase)